MSTEYRYTKTCNTERLTNDIQSSAITIALDYIVNNSTGTNNLHIWMKDTLSSSEEDTLDSIVANCSNEPLPNPTQPYTSDGIPIVTERWADIEGLLAQWESKKATFTKSPDGDVYESSDTFEITGNDFKMAGGEYWIQNPDDVHEDDYIVIDVIDIDGVIAPANTVLKTLVVKDYVKKGDGSYEFHTEYCSSVKAVSAMPEGVYFRVRYYAHGTTNDINMIYRLHYYRDI